MTSVIKKQLPEHYIVGSVPVACFQHMSQFFSVYDALQLKATCKFFAFEFLVKAPLIVPYAAGEASVNAALSSRHVRKLRVSGLVITRPYDFRKRSLTLVSLGGQALSKIAQFKLTQLRLSGVDAHFSFAQLGKMTTLEELDLSDLGDAIAFNDETLAHFSNLTQLRVLKLKQRGQISDQGMRHLKNMRSLHVLKIKTQLYSSSKCVEFLKDLPIEDLTLLLKVREMNKIRKQIPTLKKINGHDASTRYRPPLFSFQALKNAFDSDDDNAAPANPPVTAHSSPKHCVMTEKMPIDCFRHMSQFFSVYDALQLKATCKFFAFEFLVKAPLIFSCHPGYDGLRKALKSRHLAQLKITGFSMTCPTNSACISGPFNGRCISLLQELNLTRLCLRGPGVDLGEKAFEAIGKLDGLEELEIVNPGICSYFTDENLYHLSDLYELRVLKLRKSSNLISDQGMHHLRHMHHLRVLEIETFSPLNGECVNILKKLPLEELTLIDHSNLRLAPEELGRRMNAIPTLKKFIGEERILVEPPSAALVMTEPLPIEPVEEPLQLVAVSTPPPSTSEPIALSEPPALRTEVLGARNRSSPGILHYLWSCLDSLFARFVQWLRDLFN